MDNNITTIRIRELAEKEGTFSAAVSFNSGPEYPITVRDPFTPEQEKELEWYFEEHLRFPFTKKVRANDAAKSITMYGETLFQQVFQGNPKINFPYMTAVQKGLDKAQIEIAGTPKFHALHWEALKDPQFKNPLALQATMVRQNLEPPGVQAGVQASPTINLLIVIARPYGRQDVGYRTISRPLVETLRQSGLHVKIDILRPGTYKALENHLRATTSKHGVGHYHVIHFDMHGSLLNYAQLQSLNKPPQDEHEPISHRQTYQDEYALDNIEPYEGSKAFLFFEGEPGKTATPVEAAALANMLIEHHIPIAILNACQSGKQVGASETSLGSRLMQAGVQLVLAMGYSVTVSAAELLMKTLYGRLFASDDLSLAIRHARAELYNDRRRRAYFDQIIDLQDWLLPVVYQNQPPKLQVREFTPEESKAYYARETQLEREQPSDPTYGFVGRDLDILQIEKRLLTQRNLLLVRGMGGAGKTTLLRHLGFWWRTTGFINDVFYFGYDERAWTRQQLLVKIAQKLLDPVAYVRDFQPLTLDQQQTFLTKMLRAEHHLLILDNLESITGAHLAIRHTLSAKEQKSLHSFLKALSGGRTLVLLGSRGGEAWLAQETFSDNIYNLPGLDPEAASMLVDRILARHDATRYRDDTDLQHLLKLLDGFPLALEVVLPNLVHTTPGEILSALQAGDVQLDTAENKQQGKDIFEQKTESILRCIDYSHSNLSPEAQQLLLCLTPFTSVFFLNVLDKYITRLKQQPLLASLPFDRFEEVLQKAANWGLLSPDTNNPRFLRLQPTLPYFLRSRLQAPEQANLKAAIETAFREHYEQVGGSLYSLLESKEADERQIGQIVTGLEYENLVTALNLSLAAQVSIRNIYRALSTYLEARQEQQRGLTLGREALARLEEYPEEKLTGKLGFEFVRVINDIANYQLLLNQFTESEKSYKKALSTWLKNKEYTSEEIKKSSASIYHDLGRVAHMQRKWAEAVQYYQQALNIYSECNDRFGPAGTFGQLGLMAMEQRQWEQAEKYLQKALEIDIEFNNRFRQAYTYHNLGTVAQEQRRWAKAEEYYQKSLLIKIEFNARFDLALTYHNLGRVAQEQRKWAAAEQYYQQSLLIKIEFNARFEQASTYHQLGIVAQAQRLWPQAEQYYQQALQIYLEFNARYEQGRTYSQLGLLAQDQHLWNKAEQYYQLALQLFIEFNDEYEQNHTYHNLGIVTQAQQLTGKSSEAQQFLIKAGYSLQHLSPFGLLCFSNSPILNDVSPFYVRLALERVLDIEEFHSLCHEAKKAYKTDSLRNHTAAVVIDRLPNTGDLYQIFALNAQEGFTIIPLPLSMITQARLDDCEQDKLLAQIEMYTGRVDLYDRRGEVTDVLSFFGRDTILADLQRQLTRGESVMLFGVRKIGKSSLLGRLSEEHSWPIARINLEGHIESLEHFYKETLESWRSTINNLYPELPLPEMNLHSMTSSASKAQAFRQIVNELLGLLREQPECRGLLLFLDEMEYLINHPDYMQLATVLRSIAEDKRNKGRFAILMAGLDPVLNRIDQMTKKRNPFFQFFSEKPLGLLEPQEVSTMIVAIGNQMSVQYELDALEVLLKIGGGHPFLTRQLCSFAIHNRQRPIIINKKLALQAINQYLSEARSYLSELWTIDQGGPSLEESAILTKLADVKLQEDNELISFNLSLKEQRAFQLARDHLRDLSLIRQANGKWELTIPLYSQWIRQYILNISLKDKVEE